VDPPDRHQCRPRSSSDGAETHCLAQGRRHDTGGAAAGSGITESIALAFRSLPLKLQIVATLALVEEQPYSEIADALDLPVGTVKSRVFRASRLLRKELARLGITP
jgi:DNA-directed RNA polymerase specialized sigma24 family protein